MDHLNFMLLGTGNGAVFAALAVALVMVYRSSGVLNFATGALALHAAYTYAFLRQGELLIPIPPLPSTVVVGGDWGLWPAMAFTIVLEAAIGVLMYLLVFRPLRNRAPVTKAVASLGLVALLTGMIAEQAGNDQVIVQAIFPRKNFELGGLRLVGDRVFLAATLYAFGKTFFWPTTLGVVSEQFPKGGALMLNAIAGVGMISVGTIGNPAIGTLQDMAVVSELRATTAPPAPDRIARFCKCFSTVFAASAMNSWV